MNATVAELIFKNVSHDEVDFTYTGALVQTAVAKRGGVAVGTITCTYDGSNNLTKWVLTAGSFSS